MCNRCSSEICPLGGGGGTTLVPSRPSVIFCQVLCLLYCYDCMGMPVCVCGGVRHECTSSLCVNAFFPSCPRHFRFHSNRQYSATPLCPAVLLSQNHFTDSLFSRMSFKNVFLFFFPPLLSLTLFLLLLL